jgi:nitric oxide dioxygenase
VFPAETLSTICERHAALNVEAEHYDVVGENLLATISELLTDDQAVLDAWGEFYGQLAGAMVATESGIKAKGAAIPGGWEGKRKFFLEKREQMSADVVRFAFAPVDGGAVPEYTPGKYTTVWVKGDDWENTQPRHYTLALPRVEQDKDKHLNISVKNVGLVSGHLHFLPIGAEVELSNPYGCFSLMQSENIWLKDPTAPVVFLSGGIGITPVLAMLENMDSKQPVTWLHGSENGNYHPYRARLQRLASIRKGALKRRVWYVAPTEADGTPDPDDNTGNFHYEGLMDLSQMPKAELHLDNDHTEYYMCGPPAWSEHAISSLTDLGVSPDKIHAEGFGTDSSSR